MASSVTRKASPAGEHVPPSSICELGNLNPKPEPVIRSSEKTHPSASRRSVTRIGQFNMSVFIQMFVVRRDFRVDAELGARSNPAELRVVELWLKLHVSQNIIHLHLPLSGEAKQNHTSKYLDFAGLYFRGCLGAQGAADSFQSSALFLAGRQTQIKRSRPPPPRSPTACPTCEAKPAVSLPGGGALEHWSLQLCRLVLLWVLLSLCRLRLHS